MLNHLTIAAAQIAFAIFTMPEGWASRNPGHLGPGRQFEPESFDLRPRTAIEDTDCAVPQEEFPTVSPGNRQASGGPVSKEGQP